MQDTELAGHASHYHPCADGRRHWGPSGAAGCLPYTVDGDGRAWVLLSLRSRYVQTGGCWSTIGGAVDHGESLEQAARRELAEEVHGERIAQGEVTGTLEAPCPHGCGWQYTTVLLRVPLRHGRLPRVQVKRGPDAWETEAVMFWPADELPAPLHPAFAAAWPQLQRMIGKEG